MGRRKELEKQVESVDQIPGLLGWARGMTERALPAGPVLWILCRPSKSRIQEEKYHAMIGDIHRQCLRGYSFDAVKAVLVNQFAHEMAEQGQPLASPGEKAWDWKIQEPVYVRPSTTKFRKAEAAAFIEFLYAAGTDFDVQWSDKSLAIYDELIGATHEQA